MVGSRGQKLDFKYSQKSVGLKIDDVLFNEGVIPTHIKIDVDGNELLVLKGISKLLENLIVKSVLVELSESHPEYQDSIDYLESFGFLFVKAGAAKRGIYNHIFVRDAEEL